jgi:UPF0716 family protein affecting phage T7 exclusion
LFRYIPFIFFVYLICEIFVTSYFYTKLSPLLVSLFIVFMMFFGIFLIKRSQIFLTTTIKTSIFSQIDFKSILKQNILYTLSAVLFIIPGVLSDFMGIILILFVLYLQLTGKISQNKNIFKGEEDVIDAEIIDNGDCAITDNINDRM